MITTLNHLRRYRKRERNCQHPRESMFSTRTHFVNQNLPSDHFLLSNYRANGNLALMREIGRIACSQPQRFATATTNYYGATACCGFPWTHRCYKC